MILARTAVTHLSSGGSRAATVALMSAYCFANVIIGTIKVRQTAVVLLQFVAVDAPLHDMFCP